METEFFPGAVEIRLVDIENKSVAIEIQLGDNGFFSEDTGIQPVDIENQPVDVENRLVEVRFSLEETAGKSVDIEIESKVVGGKSEDIENQSGDLRFLLTRSGVFLLVFLLAPFFFGGSEKKVKL